MELNNKHDDFKQVIIREGYTNKVIYNKNITLVKAGQTQIR
jgi:hypothetical protein